MAKIDKVKETLNTLRVVLSLVVGLLVALGSKVSDMYDNNMFNIKFYISIVGINLLLVIIGYLAIKIKNKTFEIGEL